MIDVLIIGAGLSGLATAVFLRQQSPEARVVLLEATRRCGGAIASHVSDGYLVESGPHGFLDNKAESQELLGLTGLARQQEKAPLADFQRFICHKGRLAALPQKPQQLLTSPLLTPAAKLRLLGDLFKKPLGGQPTVARWAEYRFGRGVLPMVDAAVTGTFSGDFRRLSMDAVMPGVRALEKEHGSLLRGLRKKGRVGGGSGLPAMTNFPQGMESLVKALARGLDIRLTSPVRAVEKVADGWQVDLADQRLAARQLVMALPMNRSLALLGHYQPPVSEVPVSRIVTVALGFAENNAIPKGFGYLAPEAEKRFALGCMFTSRMFPGRAPAGKVLLEALVGGRRHPERLNLSDDELVAGVWEDMSQLLDLPPEPEFAKVWRPASGIPQQEEDHLALLEWRHGLQRQQPGLHICGFGWDGIGINDMTRSASKSASAVASGQTAAERPEVKPVYF